MGIREQVKQILRMCGHAMVSTVHDRLDTQDRELRDIARQSSVHSERLDVLDRELGEIAQTQTALLQSGVYLMETLPKIHSDVEQMMQGMTVRLDTVVKDVSATLAQAHETFLGLHSQEHQATAAMLASLEPAARETRDFLEQQAVRQVCVETSEYLATNPELGLMSFLYSHLQGRKAIDIGAHSGEVSEHLLKAGYEVYAFEPYPPSYLRLTGRLNEYSGFHPFNFALGAVDGELPLHLVENSSPGGKYDEPSVFHSLAPHAMPDGLRFLNTIPVPIRRLASLHRSGVVPEEISLVKIDTEGFDLEVIRGMDAYRYPVVAVEFWDTRIPFARNGLLYTMESIIREMRLRDYFWYIVLYRVWGHNQTAFFCNHDRSVPDSWGNLFFFRDNQVFAHAQQWCSAVLPRTYFKAVPASAAASH